MAKYNVIFMGTSNFAKEILIALNQIDLNIVAVISQPDRLIGRKKILTKTPVKELAQKLNLKILQPEKIATITNEIKQLNPDFIITCAYGQFIPDDILAIPKNCINIHASLLPKLRGGAPIHWAIINGDCESGITIMKMISKMDAGPIYLQKKVEILPTDTMILLYNKLIILAVKIINDNLIEILDGKYLPVVQDESKVTFGLNIRREDEKLNFNLFGMEIYNKIRGLYPNPGAYALLNKKNCKIYKAIFLSQKVNNDVKNGTICKLDRMGIYVKVQDGYLILQEIKLAGKNTQQTNLFYKNISKDINIGEIYE